MDHIKPYPHSVEYAMQNGELDICREDARLNRECVRVIDEAIRACNYKTYYYKFSDAVKTAVDAFGFERVKHTLAGAIEASSDDRKFSLWNYLWAQDFIIHVDRREEFVFCTRQEVLDGFVDSVRKAHLEMLARKVGQYEKSNRIAKSNRLTRFNKALGVFVKNDGITKKHLLARYEEITEKKTERRSVLDQIRATHKDEKQPCYTLNEILEKMEPQARRDKALMERCIDGLGLYAAQITEKDRDSSKIEKMRALVETLVGYWGLDDSEYYAKAKLPEDYLRAFDDRVSEARTGGAVTGDVFQTAPNVIYGLYRYGEEMTVCQGADAMSDILDVSDMMKEIAQAWDFEPDILGGLTARLESEVRDMLAGITLPGHPVSGVVNAGYAVTQAVMFENGLGIVLAHHPDAPSPFVTWRFGIDDEGDKWYEWGHYFSTENRAKIDYISRVGDYAEQYGITERPLPTAAAEADAEQNYNMIDGVKNNEGEPKPDLTDGQTHKELRELAPETLPEENGEKLSVLKQIRGSREAPHKPKNDTPSKKKSKGGPEL